MKPGDAWGEPTTEPPEHAVGGNDVALAAAVRDLLAAGRTCPLIQFAPETSDLARSIGLSDASGTPGGVALPLDVVQGVGTAVNMIVSGTAPDRLRRHHRRHNVAVSVDGRTIHDGPATSVVIANGQFLRGLDVVPRGHPGDGRLEVHVYALAAGERPGMRRRLPAGTHLPHPRITTTTGRDITVGWARPRDVEVDGRPQERAASLHLAVAPAAYRLLV